MLKTMALLWFYMRGESTFYLGSGIPKFLVENLDLFSRIEQSMKKMSGNSLHHSFKNPNMRRHKKICDRMMKQVLYFQLLT